MNRTAPFVFFIICALFGAVKEKKREFTARVKASANDLAYFDRICDNGHAVIGPERG